MLMLSSAVASVLAVVSLTSVADAAAIHTPQGRSIQRRRITTCRGTGQYPLPQKNVCKPCSWKFPGASICTATAALRCTTGALSKGACVTTCPASTFNNNNFCAACTTKFPGAATCSASGAIKCNTGFLSAGKCASVCPTGFVNAPSTRTCVPCNRFDNLAATCTAGKIATCNSGAYLKLNSGQNDCVPCTSVHSFATTCSSATVVTACAAPYTVSADKKSCVLGSAWSYYTASSIPDVPFDSNVQTPIICGRGAVSKGSQVAVFDKSSLTCFSTSSSATAAVPKITWDADSTVVVLGSCKTNNALIPSAKARCHDVTLTASSCTLTADKSACSTLLTRCTGSQFRDFDGMCQDCASTYQDSLTCDLFNGATTCIEGDFLSNGTCTSCSTFDPNAASCAANGTVSDCNNGWVLSNNTCVVDTSPPAEAVDTAWSYYPDSMVASLSVLNTDSVDQYDCAESIYASNLTMGAFDPVAGNCYAANATAPILSSITDVDGASVFVIDTCAANQASVPTDQGNTCYDLTLDDESCQVNGQPCS